MGAILMSMRKAKKGKKGTKNEVAVTYIGSRHQEEKPNQNNEYVEDQLHPMANAFLLHKIGMIGLSHPNPRNSP